MSKNAIGSSTFRLHSSRGAEIRQSRSQAQFHRSMQELDLKTSSDIDIVRLRKTLVFENLELQREFDSMFNYVCKLESMIRYKDKDIDRLTYLNKYLSESQKKRDDIILENQKEIQRLKQLLILYQNKISEGPRKDKKDNMMTQESDYDKPRQANYLKSVGGLKSGQKNQQEHQTNNKSDIRVNTQDSIQAKPTPRGGNQSKVQNGKQNLNNSRSRDEGSKIPTNKVHKPIGSL